MKTLLIPQKSDLERDRVAAAWEQAGGKVMRVDRFWERPDLAAVESVAIYGNDTFALVLAQVMGVALETPDDALLTSLAHRWTQRKIVQASLGVLEPGHFPCFVKPVIPKQFKASVYASLADLQAQTEDLPDSEEVLVSEIVHLEAEARAFILEGNVLSVGVYEGEADAGMASEFLKEFAIAHIAELPRSYVVDAGFNAALGWFVLEFNSAWGAGLNGCLPADVIAGIAAATGESGVD